jgi:hypothetical protein
MSVGVIAAAAGLFAVTNFDDIVILSLFFAQGAGQRGSAAKVVAGQYLAFTAILAVAVGVTFGASFLPKEALPYLGLLPIAIGLRDAGKYGETAPAATTASRPNPARAGPRSSRSPPAGRSCTAWSPQPAGIEPLAPRCEAFVVLTAIIGAAGRRVRGQFAPGRPASGM